MRRPPLALALLLASLGTAPAAHASKDMIQLQTQVEQLEQMLQHLQQTNDERMGVLQHLVEQSSDQVNRMSQQMTALQGALEQSSKNDTMAAQIQALNDSIDELKTRVGQVNKQLTDMQGQLQNVQAPPQAAQPLASGTAADPGLQGQGTGSSYGAPPALAPAAPAAPPVDQLYQGGLRDYNGARYDIASSEFADVLKFYPDSPVAGNASYYLGEISYRHQLYPAAIRYYDMVLQQYAGSGKAPAAELRKGQAELANQQRDAGIRDLRGVVLRYPSSPEGAQARTLLNGMGVRIVPGNKPSPSRE